MSEKTDLLRRYLEQNRQVGKRTADLQAFKDMYEAMAAAREVSRQRASEAQKTIRYTPPPPIPDISDLFGIKEFLVKGSRSEVSPVQTAKVKEPEIPMAPVNSRKRKIK